MPFAMYQRQLEARLGFRITNIPTRSPQDRTRAIADALAGDTPPSSIITMPRWSEPIEDLCDWFALTRAQIKEAGQADIELVMLDYYAPTCSPHFPAMAYVDRYIKRQVLADRSQYNTAYRSGFVYADFVADTWGFDLADWNFGSQIPPEHAHKLVAGWNLGITPRYAAMLKWTRRVQIPWALRPIDIHQRVGGMGKPEQKQEWYQFSRAKGIEALEPLGARYRLTPTERVSAKKYFIELCTSKVVFSPFGWGEVCFRDYEAIACGALLVKPDMSHLITEPNIYIPHETYVPIAWDYSDAKEQIDEYLSNPAKAKKIINNARHALCEYYQSDRFVDTLGHHLFGQSYQAPS